MAGQHGQKTPCRAVSAESGLRLPDQGGYHDDSLDIRVETSYWTQDIERVDEPGEGTTTVMAVYVKITDPTQIRTALAFPYPSKNTVRVERMAKQNNAVLAINGDYFIYHSEGIVYRNTHRLRELPREYRDTMIIDTEGGMHIIQGTTHQKWQDYLENGGTVAHTFCFGPGLVIDGVVRDEFDSRMDNGPKTLAQRMILRTDYPDGVRHPLHRRPGKPKPEVHRF